jgi:uncharacterized membrane protein
MAPLTEPLPAWVHELVVAPLCALLVLLLLESALGLRRAVVEFFALVAYGFSLELVAMTVFHSHDYGAAWRLTPWGVPLAVAVVWGAVIPAAIAVAARLGFDAGGRSAAAAALLATAVDLLIEPVAVRAGLWRWTPPGPWLGVPIGNFVGWGVIVGSYAWGAARTDATASLRARAAKRLVLAAASIAALVGVGLLWRGAAAEAFFEGRGELVAAGLLAGVLVLRFARRGPSDCLALPRLLGATPRGYALGIFALLLATFAWDAVGLGEVALVWLALAVSGALLITLDATRTT